MSPSKLVVSVVFFAMTIPSGPAFADTLDVFPIFEGLQVSYNYWDSVNGTGHFGDLRFVDSGRVSIRIFHAVPLNDSMIDWEMWEYWNITRTDYTSSYPVPTGSTRVDSAYCLLQETTTGMHPLYGGGVLLWRFPIHLGTSMPEVPDTMFRYSDHSPTILRFESQCDSARTYFDSLWFSVDSGLTQWRWENCFNDELGQGETFGYAQLASVVVTSIEEQTSLPLKTRLISNYPNPFNGQTSIAYDLAKPSSVMLTIYDMTGRLITAIDEGYQNPGSHTVVFNHPGISSGVYLVRLQTIEGVQSGRLIYLR